MTTAPKIAADKSGGGEVGFLYLRGARPGAMLLHT